MATLKKIGKEIIRGENLDLYLNLIIAILLAALNLFGIGQAYSTSITLSVLALLSVSNLVNRHKLEDVLSKTGQKKDLLLEEFPPSLASDIKTSKELWLIGMNLGRTLPTLYHMLNDKLQKENFKLKVLVLDPNGSARLVALKRAIKPTLPEYHQTLIRSTLADTCSLKQKFPDKIEIKVIDYPVPLGGFGIDLKKSSAVIYLEHYLYKPTSDMPKMVLYPTDQQWYNFFEDQLQTLWNDATEWNCS